MAGLLAAAGPASAQGGGADLTRLIDELDLSITGDDTTTQARKPAHTVTMLDYMGSP